MKTSSLLELIPQEQRSSEQTSFRSIPDDLPLYKFVREPTHLDDFDWKSYGPMAIWRDNGTMICVDVPLFEEEPHHVGFAIHVWKRKVECAIYGKTQASVSETATFLWSLQHSEGIVQAHLRETFYYDERDKNKNKFEYEFDFSSLSPEQLARVLDSDPTRHFVFSSAGWSAEQSLVLATRPYPLQLRLVTKKSKTGFQFDDEGTAFVSALEKRSSSFGSLWITSLDTDDIPLSRNNLERLCKLETGLEKLHIGRVGKECALLPLAANTQVLKYKVYAAHMQSPKTVGSLPIVAKDLSLRIYLDKVDNWYKVLITFFNRLAKLGHFERLDFSVYHRDLGDGVTTYGSEVAKVARAVGRVIKANPNLKHLDLSGFGDLIELSSHLKIITKAMEKHKGLRKFIVGEYPPMADVAYGDQPVWLDQLISRNRIITVLDHDGWRCSNGPRTDRLYGDRVASAEEETETEPSASTSRGTKKMRTSE